MDGTVTLKALSRLEDYEKDQIFTLPAEDFLSEIGKGITEQDKRPVSAIVNHCEVVEASEDVMAQYASFASGVKTKRKIDGTIETYPERDPFRKE